MNRIKGWLRPAFHQLPPSWRQPGRYWKTRAFYRDAQWWSGERIARWQLQRLQQIVEFAYRTVPGYRRLYDEAGVAPGDLRSLEDLRRFPFTSKELLRDNLADFTSTAIPARQRHYVTTGGSTGIPFGFHMVRENVAVEDAFMHGAWEQTGWRNDDIGVVLRGGYIGSETQPFVRTGARRHALSVYYLTENTYPAYRDYILTRRASFLHAYPSSAADLARMVLGAGDRARIPFRSIFIGSENVYDGQKKLIREAFPSARLISWYGHTEQAVWAPWCADSDRYHLCPFYGCTELVGADDGDVGEHDVGEIVGTSLWMKATPFIRYRTMDYARRGPSRCAACGREFPLLESIEGRLQEVIVSGTGRRIAMTSINMHDRTFDAVAQFRFVQREPGRLALLVVPKADYSPDAERQMRSSIESKLGADWSFEIQRVDAIPRSRSGKYSFLEQHLTVDHADRVTY